VSPMHLAMVLLAGEAGLRRGELVALERGDIGGREVVVRRNEWEGIVGLPKGGRLRRVPMTARLRTALDAVAHLRGERVLWGAEGPALVTTLQSWMEVATRRAGLTPSRDIHKLRHTFCSHLAMRGASPKAIQELAGHADLTTTMRYMHLSPASKVDAIRLLEPSTPARAKERKR
jgi:integrase